ncbi:4'-phosphopantetheinyl transferase superfamily protein [Streptomyces sp. CRN 30]|uniref:4'-phosphopantetheinyl transferase superfamily protein n=1 Tax=Streptomyces sp. CRN 30 TaxID=3075613 RepID=UPI002A804963|nr:4'-phosphopantetheinyl transferase superfamily protein [Streptomyces sp. CRN 30]
MTAEAHRTRVTADAHRTRGTADVHQTLVTCGAVRHCAGLLGPVERERAAATRDGDAADRFVVARGLLRSVLAGRLGVPPADVPLTARCPGCGAADHGPVRLAGTGGARWALSVAHAGVLVAVAVGDRTGPLGVDVETARRAARVERLAPRLFGPGERPRLARLPVPVRRAAVLAAWTAAESYAKATGTALGAALARVGARFDDRGRVTVAGPADLAGWWVRGAPARAPGCVAAVTTRDHTAVRVHPRTILTTADGPPAHPRAGPATTAPAPAGAPTRGHGMEHTEDGAAARSAALEELVRTRLAERVGGGVAHGIGREEPFADLGVDSLDIVAVLAALERECGVERIADGELWDLADSVDALVRHLSAHGRPPGATR